MGAIQLGGGLMKKIFPWTPSNSAAEENLLFDYAELRAAFLAKAAWLWWQPGMECPCFSDIRVGPVGLDERATQYRPQINCPGCGGTGTLYSEGQFIPGLLYTAQSAGVNTEPVGLYIAGNTYLTTLREHQLTLWDRLILVTDSIPVVGKTIKTLDAPIRFRFPVVRKYLLASDLYEECNEPLGFDVLWLRYSNSSGELVGAPHANSADYEVDFSTGLVSVPDAPVGSFVSARYFTYPVYKVREALRTVRHFPTKYLANYSPTGDGMNQYMLALEDMGADHLYNPSATYLPPMGEFQCAM